MNHSFCFALGFSLTAILFCKNTAQAQTTTVENKRFAIIKMAKKYKGQEIENVTPTDDYRGAVVKTKDGSTWYLKHQEALDSLGIVMNEKGWTAPKDAQVIYYDKNGVPEQSFDNPNYDDLKKAGTPSTESYFRLRTIADSAKPLYIIDGREATESEMKNLDPSTIEKIDVLKGNNATTLHGDKGKNGVVIITLKMTDGIYNKVETPASFPGGIDGWRAYLEKNLRYPKAAQKNNTQGTVRVQMVVQTDGSVTDLKTLNDPGNGLAEEAKRVIQKGPKWIPAEQGGQQVKYRFVQNITFEIQ